MILRATVVALGVALLIAGAAVLIAAPVAWPAAVELGVAGILVIAGTLFERRYRFRKTAQGADWEPTGERFNDPVTGKLMEVRWNRVTGERAYLTVDP